MGTSGKMMMNGSNGTHPRGGGGSGGGGVGRSLGVMLLLGFGTLILGVMILHKLREGRLFSLLVKEKDNELISLHLLFQGERDINKESRKKLDELKTELRSLRAQKRETDTRVLELESTLASLREEQKTVESTLKERKQEIQRLRSEATAADSQVSELQKSLRQKEEEIKSLIAYRADNVWSVSSDNPSRYIPSDPITAAAAHEKKPEWVQRGRADGSRNVRVLGDREVIFLSAQNQAGKEEDEVSRGKETDSGKKGADDHKVGGWKRRIIDENDSKNEQSLQRNHGGSAHHRFRRGNNRWREVIRTRLRETGLAEDDDAADAVSSGSRRFRRRRFEEIQRARNRNNNDRDTEEDRTMEKNEKQAQLNISRQSEHLMRGNDGQGGNEEKIKEVTGEEVQKTNRVNVTEAEKESDEEQVDHTNPKEVKETLSVVEEAKKDDSSSNAEDQAMEEKNFDVTTTKDSETPKVSGSIMEGENSKTEKNNMEEKERGSTSQDGISSEFDGKDGHKGGDNEDGGTVEADTKLKESQPGAEGSDEMAKETEF